MRLHHALYILVFALTIPQIVKSQSDLLDMLTQEEEPLTQYTIATFKGTRIVSGHTVETQAEGVLQFLIGHRFGRLNAGWRDLFGLDNATVRLGFDYGVTDNLNLGFGRSSYTKVYDGHIKYRLLRQRYGAKPFPFTVTAMASAMIRSDLRPFGNIDVPIRSRMYYTYQIMLARKFGDWLSIQVTPTIVHRNLVQLASDKNSIFSLGLGSSVKLTKAMRFNAEYYMILPSNQILSEIQGEKVRNAFSFGIDLETGGHVFQLHFTNAQGMHEKFLASETTGRWLNGDIHFGFNVSRVFTIYDRYAKREKREARKKTTL